MKHLKSLLALPLLFAAAANAQDDAPPTPNSIIANASDAEWVAILADDLLVMELAPDTTGNPRTVIIQLIPAPFSQAWVENIRTLARTHWWDGTSVNRVQDNYVTQWGDVTGEKPLPQGLSAPTEPYTVTVDQLSNFTVATPRDFTGVDNATGEKLIDRIDEAQDYAERHAAIEDFLRFAGLAPSGELTPNELLAMISIETTQTRLTEEGWHDRDGYAHWVEFWNGWPIGNEEEIHWEDEQGNIVEDPGPRRPTEESGPPYKEIDASNFWPLHCYGYVGVGRDYAPDTGSGAELYTIIGQPQRHMDRNLAVVGRVIDGMQHLSSLPRGSGDLGFYTDEEADLRTPIQSVRLASDIAEAPQYEFLSTRSESFAFYVNLRANRNDAFYTVPAGGVDICSIEVPVRRVSGD